MYKPKEYGWGPVGSDRAFDRDELIKEIARLEEINLKLEEYNANPVLVRNAKHHLVELRAQLAGMKEE